MSWSASLRPSRGRVVWMWLIPALLLLALGVGVAHLAASSHESPPTAPSPQAIAQSTAAVPEVTSSAIQGPVLTKSQLAKLQVKAATVLRLYGSFPNKKGATRTITTLRPLLTNGMAQRLDSEWAGPDMSTVTVQVTDITFDSVPLTVSNRDVTFEARVVKRVSSTNSTPTLHFPTMTITLHQESGSWLVSNIEEF